MTALWKPASWRLGLPDPTMADEKSRAPDLLAVTKVPRDSSRHPSHCSDSPGGFHVKPVGGVRLASSTESPADGTDVGGRRPRHPDGARAPLDRSGDHHRGTGPQSGAWPVALHSVSAADLPWRVRVRLASGPVGSRRRDGDEVYAVNRRAPEGRRPDASPLPCTQVRCRLALEPGLVDGPAAAPSRLRPGVRLPRGGAGRGRSDRTCSLSVA